MTQAVKQDSNLTGLRLARETTPGVLPGSPIWYQQEPNSYRDFGGEYSKVARAPINASRQRKKGVVVDLDASGGWQADTTLTSQQQLIEGVFMAAFRKKAELVVTSVVATDDTFVVASGGAAFKAGDILFAKNFDDAANNGVFDVLTGTGTAVGVDASLTLSADGGIISRVGFTFAAADAVIAVGGAFPALTTTAKNMNDLQCIAGDWVFIGGDDTTDRFATSNNNGYARIREISTDGKTMFFDKTENVMANDSGTGKTIKIYVGRFIKNEADSTLIVPITFQAERTLGKFDSGDAYEQREYLEQAYINEFTEQMNTADKLTYDISLVAASHVLQDGTVAPKTGTRPTVVDSEAFNTTSHVRRHALSIVGSPTPLYGFLSEASVSINNNISPNKAISVLGAFAFSLGTFAVDLTFQAYFAGVEAVKAIRNNENITYDYIIAQDNTARVFDIPLGALGDGRLTIAANEAIVLPLSMDAGRAKEIDPDLDYTAGMVFFDYVPDLAM
jgi:hypothetical protein